MYTKEQRKKIIKLIGVRQYKRAMYCMKHDGYIAKHPNTGNKGLQVLERIVNE